jgi:hypothetical protein
MNSNLTEKDKVLILSKEDIENLRKLIIRALIDKYNKECKALTDIDFWCGTLDIGFISKNDEICSTCYIEKEDIIKLLNEESKIKITKQNLTKIFKLCFKDWEELPYGYEDDYDYRNQIFTRFFNTNTNT